MDLIAITNYLIFSEIMRERWILIMFLPHLQSLPFLKKLILEELDFLGLKNKSERLGLKKLIYSEFINILTYRKWGIW
jgi:hypothetical protein